MTAETSNAREWVLVPREPTPEMRQAYHDVMEAHESATFTTSPDDQWDAMLAAAPEPKPEPKPREVFVDFPQVGIAGPFPVEGGKVTLPDVTMNDLIQHARTGYVKQQPEARGSHAASECNCPNGRAEHMTSCASIVKPEARGVGDNGYESFARSLVAKYGFCNWQCEETWAAAQAALAQQPAAVDRAATNSAVAAIQFALKDPEGMTFLRLWNEGEFDTLRREWPDAPVEVYIDEDPLAAQPGGSGNDR